MNKEERLKNIENNPAFQHEDIDWLIRYAKEQVKCVQELEEKLDGMERFFQPYVDKYVNKLEILGLKEKYKMVIRDFQHAKDDITIAMNDRREITSNEYERAVSQGLEIALDIVDETLKEWD